MALPETDLRFPAMGCAMRLLVGPPADGDGIGSEQTASKARELLESFGSRLSRFEPGSELVQLNSDLRETVAVSPLMVSMVGAALWAAKRTDGLLDPTLVDDLERAGYATSRRSSPSAPLADAILRAPKRRPASPRTDSAWQQIVIDDRAGTVTRPAGVRIDSGGVGKGLAADAVASLLADRERFCVDTSGDLRIGGRDAIADPYHINIEDPFGGEPLLTIRIGEGALAPTALEAETLSKQALLSGPDRAVSILEPYGGVIVFDDAHAEAVGPVAELVSSRGFTVTNPSPKAIA
ncbi:MAG: FAD:protein FMN transferase [Solirubrobacterales bacterium]|nr:FAD:protein FMN transferase [Solirubrobacterales bacterium]